MRRVLLRTLMMTGVTVFFSTLTFAQFNTTGTTTLGVTVGAEASLSVSTGSTSLANTGTIFNPYAGTTNFSVRMRTSESSGTGTVTLRVTSDFGTGGPSVATPPTTGDALTYTCGVISS